MHRDPNGRHRARGARSGAMVKSAAKGAARAPTSAYQKKERTSMPRRRQATPIGTVGVVMGSDSDWEIMQHAVLQLTAFGVPHEAKVLSAHRTPDDAFAYAESAASRGLACIIAGAGGAAHLAGVLAAKTMLPVLGVPIPSKYLRGEDSLLSTVQMPKGIPVATFALGACRQVRDARHLGVAELAALREVIGGHRRGVGTPEELVADGQRRHAE